jgi:hypothetical protein
MTEQFVDAAEVLATRNAEIIAITRLTQQVLRTLYRKSEMLEGRLANYCGERMDCPEWQTCVASLVDSNAVRIVPVLYYGNARKLSLTETGIQRAVELERKKCRTAFGQFGGMGVNQAAK